MKEGNVELYLNRLTEQTGMQIRNHWKDARHITPSPRPEATHAKPSHRTSSALHTPALSYSTYTLCNQNSPTFPCDYCTSTAWFAGLSGFGSFKRLYDGEREQRVTCIDRRTVTMLYCGVQRFCNISKQMCPST